MACGNHLLFRGNARAFQPEEVAQFTGMFVFAEAGFLPLLGSTFERVVPWERLVFVRSGPPICVVRSPAGVRPRRLERADHAHLEASEFAWLGHTWGGALRLAESGRAWGAFRDGRLVSVACTRFVGAVYESVTAATLAGHRGLGLASLCLDALGADVAARGRTATWICARDNSAARALALRAGFRPEREYVEYKAGRVRPCHGSPSPPVVMDSSGPRSFGSAGRQQREDGGCHEPRGAYRTKHSADLPTNTSAWETP